VGKRRYNGAELVWHLLRDHGLEHDGEARLLVNTLNHAGRVALHEIRHIAEARAAHPAAGPGCERCDAKPAPCKVRGWGVVSDFCPRCAALLIGEPDAEAELVGGDAGAV
jgi:hypothetical protein